MRTIIKTPPWRGFYYLPKFIFAFPDNETNLPKKQETATVLNNVRISTMFPKTVLCPIILFDGLLPPEILADNEPAVFALVVF